ncbi:MULTISPECIES: LytR/AlgR family response regulator transcription factor [Clostridium]|jgi:two-component system LytT family response regulator|uniref:Stage 0 sporulation protein A homolog n=4 Tax=Clostridium TaxID=1485 RepID=A0AAV3W5C4_9CLOT|nr:MULTISPECIES: LytTR family DNA-binding domain-containing protein [Clostridium]AVK47837.1 LytTR family transcriptional regulator [Clostridium sp. MF28]MBC2456735.1 response regulator transcription factor [Clostridium beijerinckii]MBC2474035.1 response regulator transcription factor [Clostridium beijerinckii]MCI1578119.1 LytTR family DNA-binding domain-containing protein [Clostridium beijerinckii]MCI1582998.1 LytTR family DNA-binding domain-containing protein [Clostridium beijerinckii]
MKAIIVEDEFLAREELKYFITNYSNIEIIDEFEDGIDVLKFIQNNEVDVIFMDINIPSLDGVLLAKSISKFSKKPYIVFITAYKEHAAEAFEIEAFDYILKPYSESRIVSMLKKLEDLNKYKENNLNKVNIQNKINLWKNEKIIVVNIDDIYYCVAEERITHVFTKKDEYSVSLGIAEFYDSLPKDIFFRCHRSYIVNINKIREIIPWFNNTYNLKLQDIDYQIPVSRSNIKEFKQLMNI